VLAHVLSVRTTANIALVGVLLAVVGLIHRRIATQVGTAHPPRLSRAWLGLLYGLAAAGYFVPGDLMDLDAPSHVARSWLFSSALAHLDVPPIWSNRWYLGFPMSLYYGPVYYLATGLVTLGIGGNVFIATKLTLWALHVASGFSMFALGQALTLSRAAGLFASIFYVMSFQHVGILMGSGVLPLSVIFAILPAAFFLLEHILDATRVLQPLAAAFPLALLLSVMLLAHAQYGFLAVLTFYAVVVARLGLTGHLRQRSILKTLVLSVLLVALFTSWLLLPLITESRLVMLSREPVANVRGDLTRLTSGSEWLELLTIAIWARDVSANRTYLYFGLTPLLVCFFVSAYRRPWRGTPLPAYLLCWSVGMPFTVILGRYIHMFFVLTAILAAFSTAAIEKSLLGVRPLVWRRLFLVLVILMVLDLGFTLVPGRYVNHDNSAVRMLGGRDVSTARILTVHPTRATLWSPEVIESEVTTLFGGIPQEAPPSYTYVAALASKVVSEVLDQQSPLAQNSVDALRLLNVRYVLVPLVNTIIEIPSPSPVWFSPSAAQASPTSATTLETATWYDVRTGFEARSLDYETPLLLVRRMEASPRVPRLRVVLLAEALPAALSTAGARPAQDMDCQVIEHNEGHSWVKIRYACSEAGYALLAYSYYPYNVVAIDGRSSSTFRAAMNLIAVRVPKGEHTLVMEARVSPLRRSLFAVSLVGVLACTVCLCFTTYRNGRKKGHF